MCVSSLRRGHANLLCIVPILTDDPRRESEIKGLAAATASYANNHHNNNRERSSAAGAHACARVLAVVLLHGFIFETSILLAKLTQNTKANKQTHRHSKQITQTANKQRNNTNKETEKQRSKRTKKQTNKETY